MVMRMGQSWNTYNFFNYPLSNHLSRSTMGFAQKVLGFKFSFAPSYWTTFLGLSDFATYDQEGNSVDMPKFPFQLVFQPHQEMVDKHFSDHFTETYFTQFTRQIRSGSSMCTYMKTRISMFNNNILSNHVYL